MKSFEELCAVIKRITDNPKEVVDYLTIRDYLQLRQHITICKKCDKLTADVVKNTPEEIDVNWGDASEN
jgi:transcriptional regulatory protein LevR